MGRQRYRVSNDPYFPAFVAGAGVGAIIAYANMFLAFAEVFVVGAILGGLSTYYFLKRRQLDTEIAKAKSDKGSVIYLPGSAYYFFLKKVLQDARTRILVGMYVIYLGERVSELIRIISESRAKEKLVAVEDLKDSKNREVVLTLRKMGIDARIAPGRNTQHMKVVVVDDWVIIGSHDWTESALKQNDEMSIAVRNKTIADKVSEDIRRIAKGEKVGKYETFI